MAEPTQIAYRTLKGIGLLNAAPAYQELPGFAKPEGNLRCCCYSPDGKFFAWASPEQVTVIDASAGQVITSLPAANVYELGFSPYGTYIITWQRPSKDETGNAVKNLKVWRTIDDNASAGGERAVVGEFVQRSQTGWNLQYTADESYCARVVTNEVQFYESGNLRSVWNKLCLEGVTDFAVSPGKNHSLAVFVPERKGQPASVKLYTVPNFTTPVSQKTFFKGDKVQMNWNQQGTSLIVLAQTDVDKTNKNYYGESTMFLLSTTGFDSRITLDKEGPIHDVSWSPNSLEFGVVYGYMPAKTTIFNVKAQATHNFAMGPRNTIVFSPHGRFVLVAGFGNLAGQVDIYDLTKNYTKICTIEASNASVCEWSPDGKNILFATTSPRLRVDNGIRLYHVSGGMMYNEDMNELYHVTWRPQDTTVHPLSVDPISVVPEPHESAKAALAKVKAPSKPAGAYRPPGARGTSTPLHFKREDEGGSAFAASSAPPTIPGANGFGRGARRREVPGADFSEPNLPPGAAPGGGVSLAGAEGDEGLSKAALKNKKKREAKKAKEAAERGKALNTDNGMEGVPKGPRAMSHSPERRGRHQRQRSGLAHEHGRSPHQGQGQGHRNNGRQQGAHQGYGYGHGANGSAQQQPSYVEIPPPQAQPAPDLTVTSPGGGGGPQEKKVRSLLKKLRAIEDLKMRQAAGEKLEATQVQKIQTEESVRKELNAAGGY